MAASLCNDGFSPPCCAQEGVPAERSDAYVREHMRRADTDVDGVLSLQEFILWFFTEVAALIPYKDNEGLGRVRSRWSFTEVAALIQYKDNERRHAERHRFTLRVEEGGGKGGGQAGGGKWG